MKTYKEMRKKQASFLSAMNGLTIVQTIKSQLSALTKEPEPKPIPDKDDWVQK